MDQIISIINNLNEISEYLNGVGGNISNIIAWINDTYNKAMALYSDLKTLVVVHFVLMGVILIFLIALAVRWAEYSGKVDKLSEELKKLDPAKIDEISEDIKSLNKYISGGN